MIGVLPARFPEPNGLSRAALGFGQPNGLGMFLALCVPLAAHARSIARNPVSRAASAVALAAVVAGLMATLSRGSALSVLAGALVLPLAGQWRTALKIWGGALLAAVAGDIATGGVVRETAMGALTDWSVAQRAALMLSGVRLFLEHPLVGIGPGAFAHELERAGVLVPTLQDLKPTPHNAYIQVAAETGVLGLGTLLILCAAVLRRLLRSAREDGLPPREKSLRVALLWGFGIVLAEGMVEWPLSHGHGQLVVLVVALGCTRRTPVGS
jgi:O-antigen ligase